MRLILFITWALTFLVSAENIQKPSSILLISSESLIKEWQAFADWKTSLGKPTKIISVKDIAANYKGKDIQEKIRLCILAHAEYHNTKWVILGGDSEGNGKGLVPDRDTPHTVMGRLKYKDIPSDIYYISDKNWDANDDGIYGDWSNDKENISYSNKWGTTIGRIPVRTAEDIKAYTDKIIAYETSYPETEFAKKFIYTNTVIHSQPKVIRSWDDYLSKKWAGGEKLRFFHTQSPWDKDKKGDYPLSPENWQKMINAQTGSKMHMHGHGLIDGWVLEKHKMAKANSIDKLSNKNAYLTMTTVSCFTGQFDSKKDPCISESILRAPDKGAVLVISPAREGVPIFHKPEDFKLMVSEGKLDGTTDTMTRFWINSLSTQQESYLTAGEAFYKTKQEMAVHAQKSSGYHWCQCELNLLGDPSIYLRANTPSTPVLNLPKKLTVGTEKAIMIQPSSPNSFLCIWQKDYMYSVYKSDQKGNFEIKLNANKSGSIKVTLSGPDINAVSTEIIVE